MSQLVGYARVSMRDQNAALQLDALKAAGCDRVFVETASGARVGRPMLIEALDYMRSEDTLVVWKLDRLARSLSQLVGTAEMLRGRDINLRSLTQPIDTTTPTGRLMFGIFCILAEFERDTILERTNAGLDAARARGRVGGRPKKLTDKDISVARVLLDADPPVTFAEVARRLKIKPSTLYNYFPAPGKRVPQSAGYADAPELPLVE